MSVPIGSVHERDIVLDSYCTVSCSGRYSTTEEKRKHGCRVSWTEELFTVEHVAADRNLKSAIKHRVKEPGRKLFDDLLKSKPLPPGSTGGQRGVSMKRFGKTRRFGGPKKRRTERTPTR